MLGDINLQQIHGQHVVVLEENKIKMIKIMKIHMYKTMGCSK